MVKILHIPTAITFYVPDYYSNDKSYLAWFAYCFIKSGDSRRSRVSWYYLSQEEKNEIFQYHDYEYIILDDDECDSTQ